MYDAIVVGSGASGSITAYTLANAGYKVAIIEKGRFLHRGDFSKDELAYTRRNITTPNIFDEYHIIEYFDENKWVSKPSYELGYSFFNGNIVGGSSNFMSGMFHRMHPNDFRLQDIYGNIKGANIVNWAIDYKELEPYYDMVEKLVGVSGRYVSHPFEPPKKANSYPYPPTEENKIVKLIDTKAKELGISTLTTPRAILSAPKDNRNSCYYSNFCGSYGCSSGAKGSGMEAFISKIVDMPNVTLLANTQAIRMHTSKSDEIDYIECIDKISKKHIKLYAKIFIMAAQAHESVRLLLNSSSKEHPDGLGNSSGMLGKNMLFSAGGVITASLYKENLKDIEFHELMQEGLFINRSIKDWYFFDSDKGGLLEFMFAPQSIIAKATKNNIQNSHLLWGKALDEMLEFRFHQQKSIRVEIFNDWLPNDECYMSIDKRYKDIYGMPVGKLRLYSHPQNQKVASKLANRVMPLLKHMNCTNIQTNISKLPPPNLIAGGCRFGNDAKTSYLDKNCKSYDITNLFVVDASFMPTGGSVPYTWSIYANALRVATNILRLY
jgi:choline dehydrogenase-like flavoprotein